MARRRLIAGGERKAVDERPVAGRLARELIRETPELRCISGTADDIQIRVRVQPKASSNAVVEEQGNRLRIRLTAPPVDGEANEALRRFIAKQLGIAKGMVRLIRGERSRDKTVEVRGIDAETAWYKLTRDCTGRVS